VTDVIAYIDGFNLYNGLKSKYRHRYLWLDLEALCTKLLVKDQELRAVKYFTARFAANRRPCGASRSSGARSTSTATASRSSGAASKRKR
jgi:hypothetical protein